MVRPATTGTRLRSFLVGAPNPDHQQYGCGWSRSIESMLTFKVWEPHRHTRCVSLRMPVQKSREPASSLSRRVRNMLVPSSRVACQMGRNDKRWMICPSRGGALKMHLGGLGGDGGKAHFCNGTVAFTEALVLFAGPSVAGSPYSERGVVGR